jgi:hypothetical protein
MPYSVTKIVREVKTIVETYLLAQALKAYERITEGKAPFRAVLAMCKPRSERGTAAMDSVAGNAGLTRLGQRASQGFGNASRSGGDRSLASAGRPG